MAYGRTSGYYGGSGGSTYRPSTTYRPSGGRAPSMSYGGTATRGSDYRIRTEFDSREKAEQFQRMGGTGTIHYDSARRKWIVTE